MTIEVTIMSPVAPCPSQTTGLDQWSHGTGSQVCKRPGKVDLLQDPALEGEHSASGAAL